MKVNVISRKLIKPYKPTPENLNKHNLSFLDELSPQSNVGVILFYPDPLISSPEQRLQESLSKVLTQFYPLAGRYIKNDHYVDCADQGAEWVEAETAEVELTYVVAKTEADCLKDLLPRQLFQLDLESSTDPLLSIQITVFKCGGLAIGVSIWHRIFDASSVGTFIQAWSNANNPAPPGKEITPPSFDLPELFPRNIGYLPSFPQVRTSGGLSSNSIVSKSFSFNKEAIASLRSRYLRSNDHTIVSRVRVACAFITKALIEVDQKKQGRYRVCMVAQAVNMRGRIIPPAQKHSCGNLATISLTRYIETENNVVCIQELVDLLGDGLERTILECAEILTPGRDRCAMITMPLMNFMEGFVTGEMNVVTFTDWSKFGFYEADFGWGKPVGTGIGPLSREKYMVLMENKDGDGMEVWVHLNPGDMTYFEQDQEIKKLFTT